MASLISSSQKVQLEAVFDDIYDTFKQPLRIWKKAQIAIISSDPNYNFVMGGRDTTYENIPESRDFEGIIRYVKILPNNSYMGGSAQLQERVNEERVSVRLKLREDGYNYIKDCEKIEIDGRLFAISSGADQHGLFSRTFYTLLLKEIS